MDLFDHTGRMTQRYSQYVEDLRRLFVFHGLSCGRAEDFGVLRVKLTDSAAFRTDLSALVRNIRDLEDGQISADEMLSAMALASGGEDLVNGRASSVATVDTAGTLQIFLAGVGGWRGTEKIPEKNPERAQEAQASQPASSGQPRREPEGTSAPAPRSLITPIEHVPTQSPTRQIPADALPAGRWTALTSDPARRYDTLESAHSEVPQGPKDPPYAPPLGQLPLHDTAPISPKETSSPPLPEKYRRTQVFSTLAPTNASTTTRGSQEADPLPVTGIDTGNQPPPALSSPGSKDDQPAGAASMYNFARSPVAGPSHSPANGRSIDVAEDDGNSTKAPAPFLLPTEPATSVPLPTSAGTTATQEPKRLVLTPAQQAEVASIATSHAPQDGGRAKNDDQLRKERNEKIGRRFGIAAVVLAGIGAVGLAISFRPQAPNANSPTAQVRSGEPPTPIAGSAAASKQPSSQLPPESKTPDINAARPQAQQPPPHAPLEAPVYPQPAEIDRHPRPAAPPDVTRKQQATSPAVAQRVKDVPIAGRVAGKRSASKVAEPRIEEAPTSRQTTRTASSETGPLTRDHLPGTGLSNRAHESRATPASSPTPATRGTIETASGRRVVVPESTMRRNLIASKAPVYPAAALKQNVVGTVVLNAFIAKDGTVKRIDVVKGPDIFIKSAMSAVSWRRYKPFLVGGKPVEVETPITVSYSPD